jgi:general stress protein YciG
MARKAANAAGADKNSARQVDPKTTGRGWHGDPERHAEAGRKGGSKVSENREHMAEIGRRGGAKVSENREHMAEIGRRGGSKVSQNRSHMAEIGKKGGENR